jgi:hypothetical protein
MHIRDRIELAPKSDGARYRRITLELEADGAVFLRSHAMGAAFEAVWGVDDEEITVRLPAAEVARLALALIAEQLAGERDAARALIELCETHEIGSETANWT